MTPLLSLPPWLTGSRAIRGLFAVTATIFLGAIGSGLWQVALQPAYQRVVSASLSFLASVFNGYADYLYSGISLDPNTGLVIMPFNFFVLASISGPWFLI